MAVIAQPNLYQVLSRKIGYSAGLESVVQNVSLTATKYAETKDLSFVEWKELVNNHFGKDGKSGKVGAAAHEHVANFFSALNLVRLSERSLFVLPGLETLSILRRYFASSDEKFDAGLKQTLLVNLIEADGDIFLNCLDTGFDRENTRRQIQEMVEEKWSAVSKLVLNPAVQSRLWDMLSIRSQSTPAGESAEPANNPFARRTQPLMTGIKRKSSQAGPRTAEVADSYLAKVLPTRKGWAKDLGLWLDESLTETGKLLLTQLTALGLRGQSGAFRFWPYANDLASLRLTFEALDANPVDSWSVLKASCTTYGGTVASTITEAEAKELIELMQECYQLYRSGSVVKGKLRHQIPIYVMNPALAAIYATESKPLPDLPSFIQQEIRGSTRRFDLVNVRGTEGAIIFR